MTEEEMQIVGLQDDFYRDSFGKMLVIMISITAAIILLLGMTLYLHLKAPPPITFSTDTEWRIIPAVPVEQPYIAIPDLLQWVANVIPQVFTYDFNHYNDQLKNSSQYFTPTGWKVFLNQLNIYANYNTVQQYKQFINVEPSGAPFILNEGLISGRYGWWIQIPIDLTYTGVDRKSLATLTLQVLVVRVPTLNNLTGVGIENVIVSKAQGIS